MLRFGGLSFLVSGVLHSGVVGVLILRFWGFLFWVLERFSFGTVGALHPAPTPPSGMSRYLLPGICADG
eukprot:7304593-Alexandrium_andersonii.AAC.1